MNLLSDLSCPSLGWLVGLPVGMSVGRSVLISSFTHHASLGSFVLLKLSLNKIEEVMMLMEEVREDFGYGYLNTWIL